jgi:hypothetical protein
MTQPFPDVEVIEANPRPKTTAFVCSVLLLVIIVPALVSTVLLFIGVFIVDQPLWNRVFIAIATLLIGWFSVGFGLIFLTSLLELRLARPMLRIDDDGILDRRLRDDPIPWQMMESADASPGNQGIILRFRRPVQTRPNPRRYVFEFNWNDGRSALVSINPLLGPMVDPEAFARIATRNGIEVSSTRGILGTSVTRPFPKP